MRKWLLVILLVVQYSFSQEDFASNARCIRSKNLSERERFSRFPFVLSSQIKVIAFKGSSSSVPGQDLIKHINSITVGKDTFDPTLYDEVATLNSEQINQLTDIIFNYTYTKKPYESADAKCYMPRNAIFFLDKNNVIVAYLELCFGCNNYRSSNERLTIGEYCDKKYDMLKAIFASSKIEFGITTEE